MQQQLHQVEQANCLIRNGLRHPNNNPKTSPESPFASKQPKNPFHDSNHSSFLTMYKFTKTETKKVFHSYLKEFPTTRGIKNNNKNKRIKCSHL